MGGWADGGLAAHRNGDVKRFGTLAAWRGVWPALDLSLREWLPIVFPLEALDAAGSVQELLLPREERMALGTHFDPDLRLGRSGVNDLAAIAGDRRIHVLGMNASLHGAPPNEWANKGGQRLPVKTAKRNKSTTSMGTIGWY
jgi:hypothetical protein